MAGCLVERMAPPGGREIRAGFRREGQFGPVVMFGLSGIPADILGDVSRHLIPLSRDEAFGMMHSIRAYPLLKGPDGGPGVNLPALEDALLALAALARDFPQVYAAEFDPIPANHELAPVADVRLTLQT